MIQAFKDPFKYLGLGVAYVIPGRSEACKSKITEVCLEVSEDKKVKVKGFCLDLKFRSEQLLLKAYGLWPMPIEKCFRNKGEALEDYFETSLLRLEAKINETEASLKNEIWLVNDIQLLQKLKSERKSLKEAYEKSKVSKSSREKKDLSNIEVQPKLKSLSKLIGTGVAVKLLAPKKHKITSVEAVAWSPEKGRKEVKDIKVYLDLGHKEIGKLKRLGQWPVSYSLCCKSVGDMLREKHNSAISDVLRKINRDLKHRHEILNELKHVNESISHDISEMKELLCSKPDGSFTQKSWMHKEENERRDNALMCALYLERLVTSSQCQSVDLLPEEFDAMLIESNKIKNIRRNGDNFSSLS